MSGLLGLLLNLVHLGLLMLAVHLTGAAFAFAVLHPMLGFILFLLLVGAEVLAAALLGLQSLAAGVSPDTCMRRARSTRWPPSRPSPS